MRLNPTLALILIILLALSIVVDIYKLFFKRDSIPDTSPDLVKDPEPVQFAEDVKPNTVSIPDESLSPKTSKKNRKDTHWQRSSSGVKKLSWNVIETPPPDYRKFRSCELKHDFKSLAEAEEVVKKMLASSKLKRTNKALRGYKCDFCNYYHIGHQSDKTNNVERNT